MREHAQSGRPRLIGIAILLFATAVGFGCSKSDRAASRDVEPLPSLAATVPAPAAIPVAPPTHQTAAERMVEIDRLLATPLTGTPQQADERALLRAERAALISSGQVPYVFGNQAPDRSGPATMSQYAADGDSVDQTHAPADSQGGGIVIAPNSQASSLPFLEQMTPSERDHYFEELWLQNSSVIDVNHNGFGFGRFGLNRRWGHMRPSRMARMANQPLRRGW